MYRGLAAEQAIKTGQDHVSCFSFLFISYSTTVGTRVGVEGGEVGGGVMAYHMG